MSELSVRVTAARALRRSAENMGIRAVGGMETDIFTDAVLAAVADHDGLADALLPVLSEHTIECTGLGEVTCRACRDRGWMSWHTYREHVAAHLADVVRAWLRDPS